MGDVVPHRLLRQRKARGDLRVVQSLRNVIEDLALAGAGAIRSTAADMLKYLAAQLEPAPCDSAADLPQSKTLPEAIERSQTVQAEMSPNAKIAYAWMLNPSNGTYWHNGGTGGYSVFALFNPKQRYAAVVLTNLAVSPTGSMLADTIGEAIVLLPAFGLHYAAHQPTEPHRNGGRQLSGRE